MSIIEIEERMNQQESLSIIEFPTQIYPESELARMLSSSETQFILPDEYACYNKISKGPRFLATKGLFTCIAVFASDPFGRAFASHVTVARLYENFMNSNAAPLLPELTNALKWVFKKTKNPEKSVKVFLVGGQRFHDHNMALGNFFPDQVHMHSFAWHVKDAITSAGLSITPESTRLLHAFPEVNFSPFLLENNQYTRHHSFSLAALDRVTGNLVTHTLCEDPSNCYSIPSLNPRDSIESQRYAESFTRCMGKYMARVVV